MHLQDDTAPPPTKNARERILDAAAADFPRYGIRATGVDAVIRHAQVTKATFYRHFPSKDELVASYLTRVGNAWLRDLLTAVETISDDPAQQLLSIFDHLETQFMQGNYRGCPFIAAMCEFSEPSHPCYELARLHYTAIQAHLEGLASRVNTEKAEEIAHQIVILVTGAMATAFREQVGGAAKAVKPLVENLLST